MTRTAGQVLSQTGAALVVAIVGIWPATGWSQTDDWAGMLESISTGVVSIKIDLTRAFDTERNISSQATGFVVDAELGLILTNRHVVTPGPVNAEALFLNQEELPLVPVYRDPVHDFGLFRYDPEKLKYIKPAELELRPDLVAVGSEVRVVGNDAGEQLSILSATIARLNRRAPAYGYGNYNDFNTFYIQAASGTSGGSSGSPVFDSEGRVVALNAGASSSAASSFFLPLDRVKRAVDLIRAGKPVTRGTIETQFVHRAFDELRRLGLQQNTEEKFRRTFPAQTGMLVVANVLRDGVAEGQLQVGDILLSLNGRELTEFVSLEDHLDSNIGAMAHVVVERNGQMVEADLQIADLHEITPSEFIQIGDGVFHNLSYQQAWHMNKEVRGVYIASPGFLFRAAGIPRQSVIVELDGKEVHDIDDFEAGLAALADGQKAAVRFFTINDPQSSVLNIVRMDRRWFPTLRCKRDDEIGRWPCYELEAGPDSAPATPHTASYIEQENSRLRRIAPSLALVNYDMPYTISGVGDRHYYGTGLVVDAERGYVVVDRNTVPEAMGDVRITFAGSVEVPGKVEFIHPLHNLALLSYDPKLAGTTPIQSARLNDRPAKAADELLAVGLRRDSQLVSQSVRVASVDAVGFGLSRTMRFRDTNLETLSLVSPPRDFDGVLLNKRGEVAALWSSFAYEANNEIYQANMGVPVELVDEMLQLVTSGQPLYSLETELRQVPLSVARNLGLSDEWIATLEQSDPERRQLLGVIRTVAGTNTAGLLQSGDLILSIDDQPVTRFRQVERAVQKPAVDLVVWRNRQAKSLRIETTQLNGQGVRRALIWGGALLQAPYRQMAAQRGIGPEGVYVAYFAFGSPAARANLSAGSRIIEVDGQKVTGLNGFIEQIQAQQDSDYIRLTTIAWNDSVKVITLKPDNDYWPAAEILYNGDWHRVPVKAESAE
jgi:S1-C subfamily serine protease